MNTGRADRIAVDWGTSRFRTYLLAGGAVLERVETPQGVANVAPGEHAGVLAAACGPWMADNPGIPVLLVGMVGSRNGWIEAPYADAPCGAAEIAAARIRVPGTDVDLLPGVRYHDEHGAPDVMRGEETLVLGAGIADGLVCLPGTHSKWVEVSGARISRFATFVTGELFGTIRDHAFISRLAAEPEDPAGFAAGLEAARRDGGVLHRLFETRARVLDGIMDGAAVRPFLSGLLIGSEIEGAATMYDVSMPVRLVADGVLAENYAAALDARSIAFERIGSEQALTAGLAAVDAALREVTT